MAVSRPVNSKVGFAKGSVWGTAVAVGANDQVPYLECDLPGDPEILNDDTVQATAERAPPDFGSNRGDTTIRMRCDYRQPVQMFLRALLFGNAGVPTTVEVAVAFKHVFTWQPHANGLFASGAFHADAGATKAIRIASLKPSSILTEGRAGQGLDMTTVLMGGGYDRTTDPSAISYTFDPNAGGSKHVLHRQMESLGFRCNAQSAGALGSTDVFFPASFRLTIDRQYEAVFSQASRPDEPETREGGFSEIRLEVDFYQMTTGQVDLFRDALELGTALKADWQYEGDDLPSTAADNEWELNWFFPHLRVVEAPFQLKAGRLPQRVVFTAHSASTLPTGFPTGYTQALIEEHQNETATDYLA